jgi:hypothetical protein
MIMTEEPKTVLLDPSINVKNMIEESITRLDDLRKVEVRRIDEKIDANDAKYQIQFVDSKEAVLAALVATKEAINKADVANEKRFDSVNEFRNTLADQQTKLLTRTEYESAHKALAEKIDGVTDRINRTEGASGVYVTQSDLNSALNKLQTNIETTLQPVVAFMNSQTGKTNGLVQQWVYVVGFFGIISTIITLVIFLTGHFK